MDPQTEPPIDPAEIRRLLEQAFPGARVEVAGDGRHFQALVVSEAFAGKGLLERHRMVYAALGERMPAIHALSIQARTPEELPPGPQAGPGG